MMKVSNVILAVLVSTILTLPAAGEPAALKKCQICHGKELEGKKKSQYLIEKILASGLEPFVAPEPLPPIKEEEIELLVWMGITIE